MFHKFTDTRYYVIEKGSEEENPFGCPIKHFSSSEDAIEFCEGLESGGKNFVVEEVTWHNDTHRSHSIIFSK